MGFVPYSVESLLCELSQTEILTELCTLKKCHSEFWTGSKFSCVVMLRDAFMVADTEKCGRTDQN